MKIFLILLILALSPDIVFSAGLKDGSNKRNNFPAADSLNKLAEASFAKNLELAKTYAGQAYAIANKMKYTKGQADALYLMSRYYLTKEIYFKTLEYYYKIIDLYDQQHDNDSVLTRYAYVIQLFVLLKDFDLAKKYLGTMAGLAHKSTNPLMVAHFFLNQAKYYLAKKEYDLAIGALFQCIPYFRKANDNAREGAAYKYLGDAFIQKKMYRNADYNFRMALAAFHRIHNEDEIAIIYTRLACIFLIQKNYKLNLEYDLRAMRIREKCANDYFISSSYLNVGDAYWIIGKKDSARLYLFKSLHIAEKIKRSDLIEAVYSSLYDYAKEEKNYDEALKYFMIRSEIRSKISQAKNSSTILLLEAGRAVRTLAMQNDLLNKEIQIQRLEIRNHRIQFFIFEIIFIIMLSLIFFIDILSQKNRKRRHELKELNSNLTQEINVRVEAKGRLKRSEELHRFLAENTVDVISLMDSVMHRQYISPSCEKFYGYSAREILRMQTPLELVMPAYHVAVNQHLLEMFRTKNSTRYIYKVVRKDGSSFWAEASINPIVDPVKNEVKNLISVVRDISDRMKHEEEISENSRQKEYLLREIHNRVKNNFAILISLMNMQRDQSANPELGSSLTDLTLRVRTMSLVHEQLYKAQEISTIPFDNYLHHLTLIIASSFSNRRIQLQTEITPCKVAIEMALPLGLIINELLTNAYKYAFPGDRTGNIWVRLLPGKEEKFCVSISDDGIGLPEDFSMNTTQSMGSQIVEILVEQIEATLEVSGNGGACFRILFSTSQEK